MERTVLHCDCNSFFASVETVRNPSLAHVPMAVAGDEEARHGIILAKNELAKKTGVVTAETIWSAKKKCPDLVLVPPHYEDYAAASEAVRRIYEQYTDLIEPFGMDEAWLDVTGSRSLFGTGKEIAERIRTEVKEKLHLTLSIGVSFNKVFAKLGSDYKKPDAVTVISHENYKQIVYPLAVDSLLFVGKQTAEALAHYNIHTIGDLAEASPAFLQSRFGKAGEMLSVYARGEDQSPVASIYEKTDAKSIGNGMTFRHDLINEQEIMLGIGTLAEDVAYRLRRHKMKCTTVGITVKDPLLKSFTRQQSISPATDLAREIRDTAYRLLCVSYPKEKPIRMLTVTAMNLIHAENVTEQIGFFDGEREEVRQKTEQLETTVDSIRLKFGSNAVTVGSALGNDIGIAEKHKKTH